jgi:signal transduction histidine kinase
MGSEFEARWREWLTEHNRRSAWIVLALTGTCYPLFGILDWLVGPREWLWLLWGSRAVVLAGTLVMLALVRRPIFDRHAVLLTTGFMILVAGGIAAMIAVMGGLASPYATGLILVSIAVTIFLWPPRAAILFQGTLLAMFVLPNVAALDRNSLQPTILNLFFLGFAALFMTASQLFSYRGRRAQVQAQVSLEQTTANLEAAHAELKRLDEFKSQFFANITHELKTPLAMMLASLELLGAGEVGPLAAPQQASVESMLHNGLKLLRMIGDILDLSKLDESRIRLRVEQQDLARYLRALVQQVQPLTRRKRIELTFTAEPPECPLWYDGERMERVLVNLLSNAAKFTPEGGHIRVTLEERAKTVLIGVADDGPGFPPDKAEALFERFYQVDMGATRRHGGSGLGLSLARDFVALHGGRIWAESIPGEGARFWVELQKGRDHFDPAQLDRRGPRRDVLGGRRVSDQGLAEWTGTLSEREDYRLLQIADATERRIGARHPQQEQPGQAVLVVDDTPDILQVVHMTLCDRFKVHVARDGLEGLSRAKELLPSLIITDLMMPGIDGHELIRRLRQDAATRRIPVIMLSARGEAADRAAGLEVGANGYLAKPFSPRELRGAVQSLLRLQDIQADAQLAHRMDALETLAVGLAHEFNNALNQIRPALAVVEEDCRTLAAMMAEIAAIPPDEDWQRRAHKLMDRIRRLQERAAGGAARIAHTVTLMGHYASEGRARAPQPHDLFAAVEEVCAIVRPPLGLEVRIERRLEGDGLVYGVPEELHQLLTNLLSNAYDAAPAEGGQVLITGRRRGEMVVLSVADNGPGVPEAIRERLFDPFFTTKPPGRGVGLGLNIAWRVAQRHRGTLALVPSPLPGACFELVLPAAPPSADSAHAAAADQEIQA